MTNPPAPLVLASGSRYRRAQLEQIGLHVENIAPDIAETALPCESAEALARRLALAKAETVANQHPGRWVLAGDQTAECNARLLDKPGTTASAHAQLTAMSGQEARFYSAFCLRGPGVSVVECMLTRVQLRRLSPAEITAYIEAEQPLDCCGSFKVEGRGITLFEWVRSEDPSALIGLPLIAVSQALRRFGLL